MAEGRKAEKATRRKGGVAEKERGMRPAVVEHISRGQGSEEGDGTLEQAEGRKNGRKRRRQRWRHARSRSESCPCEPWSHQIGEALQATNSMELRCER